MKLYMHGVWALAILIAVFMARHGFWGFQVGDLGASGVAVSPLYELSVERVIEGLEGKASSATPRPDGNGSQTYSQCVGPLKDQPTVGSTCDEACETWDTGDTCGGIETMRCSTCDQQTWYCTCIGTACGLTCLDPECQP